MLSWRSQRYLEECPHENDDVQVTVLTIIITIVSSSSCHCYHHSYYNIIKLSNVINDTFKLCGFINEKRELRKNHRINIDDD